MSPEFVGIFIALFFADCFLTLFFIHVVVPVLVLAGASCSLLIFLSVRALGSPRLGALQIFPPGCVPVGPIGREVGCRFLTCVVLGSCRSLKDS